EPSIEHVTVHHLEHFFKSDYARGFVLGDRSFARLTIVSDGSEEYAVLTIHHALYDGWSLPLLVNDLLDAFYGRPTSSRPSFSGIVDYVQAQDANKSQAYWESVLYGIVPTKIGSIAKTSVDGDQGVQSLVFDFPINNVSLAAIRAEVTLATLTKFAWAMTLAEHLRQRDVVFVEIVSNRNAPVKGIERMLGAALSAVPCRIVIDDAAPLSSLLRKSAAPESAAAERIPPIDEPRSLGFIAVKVELSVVADMLSIDMSFDSMLVSRTQVCALMEMFKHALGQVSDVVLSHGCASDLWNLSTDQAQRIPDACCSGPEIFLTHDQLHHA
ncbi:hypothetical protein AeMF1_007197, partial [Aphanomyces euteiches]